VHHPYPSVAVARRAIGNRLPAEPAALAAAVTGH
jgi:hypothetical protein